MAEKGALQKLEEQLRCTICLDTYTDPKVLQCDHVYCRECLRQLLLRNLPGERSLTCPNCRQDTPVPENGVQGLQPAFQINNFLEIQDVLKKDAEVGLAQRARAVSYCHDHIDEELKLYCETCKKLICFNCVVKDAKHHGCEYGKLSALHDRYRDEMGACLGHVKTKLEAIERSLEQFEVSHRAILDQRAVIEIDIHSAICQLHELVENRKTKLLQQLDHFTQNKLNNLSYQANSLKEIQKNFKQYQTYVEKQLETSTEVEVVEAKASIGAQVEKALSTFQHDILIPQTKADMTFTTSPQMVLDCESYGTLSMNEILPDPRKCSATGDGLKVAFLGKTATIAVQTINYWDEPCEVPDKFFQCELISEINGMPEDVRMGNSRQKQCELKFKPSIKGRHQLHIKISDQHIRGSPFTLLVKSPVSKIGSAILTITDVDKPWGIVINHKRQIVVSEHDKHQVSVFSLGGVKIRSFGSHGSNEGQLNNPRGVAVDEDDNILVCDYKNNRIQKFTSGGEFLAAVGTRGNRALQFKGPRGITFNTINKKVYVVDENHHVQILNPNLSYFGVFGGPGSQNGQLTESWGIVCDKFGRVYIPIRHQNRVQVFTADGNFISTFGKFGFASFPLDIAFGSENNVLYVSDRYRHHVSVFTLRGELLGSFGDGLHYPRGLAVDSGVVYVCDNNNNRISIY